MNLIVEILSKKKLNFQIAEQSDNALLIQFYVQAKPGAKKELFRINETGELTLAVREKPVDGEANAGIIDKLSDIFGTAKSKISIVAGQKSRRKKIQLLLELSPGKDQHFYLSRIENFI